MTEVARDHLKRVADEFARQAQTFERWAERIDDQLAARLRAALGAAAQGNLLDLACGPGIVSAAIARGAASVVGLDATEEMLERARSRCAKAGLRNVDFTRGDAENLPFADATFDGLVTRAAVHHFADPQRAFAEMFRVLRGGGIGVVVDLVSSEDAAESRLHNAIERLRDPSHIRMLPASELIAGMAGAGFHDIEHRTWDMNRKFEEWMCIVNDPARAEPIRIVVRALAEAGRNAGIGLSIRNDQIVFFHRWCLVRARKPPEPTQTIAPPVAAGAKPVGFNDLLEAFELVGMGGGTHQAFLCRPTGKIYWHSEWSDLDEPEDDKLPEDFEADENYIPIPDKRELDLGKPLVLAFAREFLPNDFDEVRFIFSKRGAYANFRALLTRRNALDRWYDFESKATEQALREWCELNSIALAD
jgi:ubiquinone/menaquinone biosynthesis C-methylase UbiE